jgi:hypothetical protein
MPLPVVARREPSLTRDQIIKAVANSSEAPAAKRKTLAMLGVKTEYVAHQGKKEMARRLKKNQKGL